MRPRRAGRRPGFGRRSRALTSAVLAGATALGPACTSPAPDVVRPAAPDLLDPEVRRLVDRTARAVEERPRSGALHGRLGLVYEANDLWAEARESFDRAATLDPAEPLWRLHLGIAAAESGDPIAALALFRELAAEDLALPALEQRLGRALLEAGEPAEALAAFRRLQQAAPNEPEGYVGEASALLRLGDPRAATVRLERALTLEPRNREAHHLLGQAYRALGREEEARQELALGLDSRVRHLPDPLRAEIERYAVSLPARLERARALRSAGRLPEAAEVLERALAARPGNLVLIDALAMTRLALGDSERALELLRQALEADPDRVQTQLNLADWALAAGRPAEALERADGVIARAERLARPHAVRGQALVRLGRYPEAIASLERALELEIRDPALYLGLGVLYESAARWREARSVYERALERWPDLAPARIGLAGAALALGERAAAERALAAARALEPESPRLAELEARLRASAGGTR